MTIGKETHRLIPPIFQMLMSWEEGELVTELTFKITITFHANYGEPPLTRNVTICKDKGMVFF